MCAREFPCKGLLTGPPVEPPICTCPAFIPALWHFLPPELYPSHPVAVLRLAPRTPAIERKLSRVLCRAVSCQCCWHAESAGRSKSASLCVGGWPPRADSWKRAACPSTHGARGIGAWPRASLRSTCSCASSTLGRRPRPAPSLPWSTATHVGPAPQAADGWGASAAAARQLRREQVRLERTAMSGDPALRAAADRSCQEAAERRQ
eukprot:357346-Chlamydomonas_euryale.AAC.7